MEQNIIRNQNSLEKSENRSAGIGLMWNLHLDENNQSCRCQIGKNGLSWSAEEDGGVTVNCKLSNRSTMMHSFKKGKYQRNIYRKRRRVDGKMSKINFPLYWEIEGSQPEQNRRCSSNGDDPEKTNDSSRKHEVAENAVSQMDFVTQQATSNKAEFNRLQLYWRK